MNRPTGGVPVGVGGRPASIRLKWPCALECEADIRGCNGACWVRADGALTERTASAATNDTTKRMRFIQLPPQNRFPLEGTAPRVPRFDESMTSAILSGHVHVPGPSGSLHDSLHPP